MLEDISRKVFERDRGEKLKEQREWIGREGERLVIRDDSCIHQRASERGAILPSSHGHASRSVGRSLSRSAGAARVERRRQASKQETGRRPAGGKAAGTHSCGPPGGRSTHSSRGRPTDRPTDSQNAPLPPSLPDLPCRGRGMARVPHTHATRIAPPAAGKSMSPHQ